MNNMKNSKFSGKSRKCVCAFLIMALCMSMPLAAFADTTDPYEAPPVPTYLSTEALDGAGELDITISSALNMVSDGKSGSFDEGVITVINNNNTGTIKVDKVKYDAKDDNGWELVKATEKVEDYAVNAMKYTLEVFDGDNFADLYAGEVAMNTEQTMITTGNSLDIRFKGNISPSSNQWANVEIGSVVLTISLYAENPKYQVFIEECEGGTIELVEGVSCAKYGDEVLFKVTPNDGFQFVEATVADKNNPVYKVSIKEDADPMDPTVQSFIMQNYAVKISAVFEEI